MKRETDATYSMYSFAYCGSDVSFTGMLQYLSGIAEEEKWSFDEDKPYSILKKYILKTFEQCNKQGKISYSSDNEWCCLNTGLLTKNGKDIYIVFNKNRRTNKASEWYLKGFYDSADRFFMETFDKPYPEIATYTDNFEELFFNPFLPIEINIDHILDDNWERISLEIPFPKNILKTLIVGVIEQMKIKVKRNVRLAVPQFYNNKIMHLLPIVFPVDDDKEITMALAVEKISDKIYRANTIFSKETAYEKARLLMKPESNWLIK